MSKRVAPYAILALILFALLGLKAQFEFGLGPRAHDADYYYDIARHVAQGEGLKSNLSLYFQGFKSFPHAVTASPVWPLTLGSAGALFGIDSVATRLPNAIYFADLLLLYFFALRLWRRMTEDPASPEKARRGFLFRQGWIVNFGHVAVLLFATNIRFFRFTSVPNNEALAFFWIFSGLIALDRAVEKRSAGWAGFAGLLASLALLTRVQALGMPVAVPAALLAVAGTNRAALRLVAAALVGAALPLLPWAIYLTGLRGGLTLNGLLGMETQYETPELGVLSHTVSIPTLWGTVIDRLQGLGVAFHPESSQSYVHHFNTIAYVVPFALLIFGWHIVRAGRPRALAIPPRYALLLATLGAGLIMLVPVHMSHMDFSKAWLFGFRHGLPLVLLILPALAYVDAHSSRISQIAATGLLGLSLAMSAGDMKKLMNTPFATGLRPIEGQLVNWLDSQSPRPAVVTTRPWELGTYSRSGYHWILCKSDPAQTLRLIHRAGADYVLVFDRDRRCPFVTGLHPQYLEIVRTFGKEQIYVLAPPAGAAAVKGRIRSASEASRRPDAGPAPKAK